jgi:hypothetical protein
MDTFQAQNLLILYINNNNKINLIGHKKTLKILWTREILINLKLLSTKKHFHELELLKA